MLSPLSSASLVLYIVHLAESKKALLLGLSLWACAHPFYPSARNWPNSLFSSNARQRQIFVGKGLSIPPILQKGHVSNCIVPRHAQGLDGSLLSICVSHASCSVSSLCQLLKTLVDLLHSFIRPKQREPRQRVVKLATSQPEQQH